MLAYIVIIWVYFYGVGNPPQMAVEQAASVEECKAVLADVKTKLLAKQEVRDVQGGCLTAEAPAPRDKV